jgi:hypothetical protein
VYILCHGFGFLACDREVRRSGRAVGRLGSGQFHLEEEGPAAGMAAGDQRDTGVWESAGGRFFRDHESDGSCLLFLHGTFSNAAGAFQTLAATRAASGRDFFSAVAPIYGNRIYAFNHFTVSQTPEKNGGST